jgi:hypothetical protein
MPTVLILGAGHSAVAGAPAAHELLLAMPLRPASASAARRHEAVLRAFATWLTQHPGGGPERFLEELATNHSPVPFQWGVELMAAEIAEALSVIRSPWTSPRYAESLRRPLRVNALADHWHRVDGEDNVVAVLTFNYDLVAERLLRHKPMTGMPGFHYGGIGQPQVAVGSTLWSTSRRELRIEGAIPLFKLHGSLSWALGSSGLELRQDYSPAMRDGCAAAHVAPRVEKDVPRWLRAIWEGARQALESADRWVVAGYSAPSYDVLARELFHASATAGRVRQIDVFTRSDRTSTWTAMAPAAVARDRGLIR